MTDEQLYFKAGVIQARLRECRIPVTQSLEKPAREQLEKIIALFISGQGILRVRPLSSIGLDVQSVELVVDNIIQLQLIVNYV